MTSLHIPSGVAPEDPLIGQQINNLRIVERIGRGGFGQVYRAEHVTLHTSFAVKVLHLDMQMRPEVVARFQREARAIAMLDHINVVRVTDFGQFGAGSYYLAMDFLQGQTLADALASGERFSAQQLGAIMHQICVALGYIHQKGIVHRDLKPGNIYLCESARRGEKVVKLLDFGIASLQSDPSITQTGSALGSPVYMSPEQAMGNMRDVDGRTDVYSLGVILYHLLTGVPPFLGDGFGVFVVKHLYHEPPPLEQTAPHVLWTSSLELLLQKMLAKHRDDRPGDMLWLAHNIREVMEEQFLFAPDCTYPAFSAKEVQGWSEVSSTGGLAELLPPKASPEAWDSQQVQSVEIPVYRSDRELTRVTPPPMSSASGLLPSGEQSAMPLPAQSIQDIPQPHVGVERKERVRSAHQEERQQVEERPESAFSWFWLNLAVGGLLLLLLLWGVLRWSAEPTPRPQARQQSQWVERVIDTGAVRASVWRDGKLLGYTPLQLSEKPGQSYQIELRASGHLSERMTLRFTRDRPVQVNVALPLRETSRSQRKSTSTRARIALHNANASGQQGSPQPRSTKIPRQREAADLRPAPRVWLVIRSRPRRARVWRGRQFLGHTPVVLRGRPGDSFVIRLRTRSYRTRYRKVTFPTSGKRIYSLRLQRLRKHKTPRRDTPGGIIGNNPFE